MPHLRFAAAKEQRVAVITGGARGLGRACALRIAEEGRHVVLADVLDEEASETVDAIQALGQDGFYCHTDVTDEQAVKNMILQAMDRFGRIDILVCCAGILGLEAPFLEQSATQFDKVMKINLRARSREGIDSICFSVDDMDHTQAELAKHGIELSSLEEFRGNQVAFVSRKDACGISLEFIQPAGEGPSKM